MVEKSEVSSDSEPMDHQETSSANKGKIAFDVCKCNVCSNVLISGCERSPSFKERHPKFRKSATPDYMLAADQARTVKLQRQSSLSETTAQAAVQRTPSPPTPEAMIPERIVFPPQQHIIQTEEDVNVDVVDEETEEGPIDMSIRRRSPSPPAYKYTPLRPRTEHLPLAPPPPAYVPVLRPPPPPYPVSQSPPISSTTPTKADASLPPPPSYSEATVKCSYPSPPSQKKELMFKPLLSPDVSTTTKDPIKRRNKKAAPRNDDDRPIREITIITGSFD